MPLRVEVPGGNICGHHPNRTSSRRGTVRNCGVARFLSLDGLRSCLLGDRVERACGSGRAWLLFGVGGEEDRGCEADQGEGGEADHREDVGPVLVAVGEVRDRAVVPFSGSPSRSCCGSFIGLCCKQGEEDGKQLSVEAPAPRPC